MPFGLRKKKAQVTVDRQRQVDICYATRQLEQGNLSSVAVSDPDKPIVLSFQNISLAEPRLAQGTLEGGIKEKIAKGLYFYVGQAQDPGLVEELVQLDVGTMTITSDGIAFVGRSKHISIDFGDIDSMGHTNNGITISARTHLQRLRFEGADKVVVPLKVQDRMYNQRLSGRLMRILLEAVMNTSLDRRR
ncbi:MAG TPA: hypothetical protein VGQ13_06130 [Nitrososphaera sp.]|jgi:hypothetical protein|nr:hypothetical protein [Nitrososphaera sp.]